MRHAAPPPPQGHPVRALPSSVRLRGGYKTKSAPRSSHNTLSRAQQPPNTSKSFQDLLSDSSMCLATQQQVPTPPHRFPHHLSFARFIFGRAHVSQTPPCHSIASHPPPTTCDRSPPIAPAHESESFTIRGTCESLRYPRARTLYEPPRLQLACVYACSSHALPPTPLARSESGDTCRAAAWC